MSLFVSSNKFKPIVNLPLKQMELYLLDSLDSHNYKSLFKSYCEVMFYKWVIQNIQKMQIQSELIIYHPKKQLLSCRLCTDIFKKPITLACGHTFCYYCLYKFMRQHCIQKKDDNNKKSQQSLDKNNQKPQNKQYSKDIPLPLCPTCSSLILKPIKYYRQNLTLTNLITHAKYKPQLKFDNQVYDQDVQNFNHKILIRIQTPKIQSLPFCYSEIRFSTCFLDDILQQSHSSYIVIEWPNFKEGIGLAGKILRTEIQYHSSSARQKENHYRGFFNGLFFVKIQKRRAIQINLKSRYYTEAAFYADNQQLSTLNICKCQQFHSQNILPLSAFDQFLSYYDTLNNPHYLNQIYRIVDPKPFFQRNNPEAMIYCCIRILKLKPEERKLITENFDDKFRIHKINQFLRRNGNLPVQDFMHISIPGKYNSAFVFAVIFMLILLHYIQSN